MIAHQIHEPRASVPRGGAEVRPHTDADTQQQARRLNFIKANRLSPSEAGDLPVGFDPGPEFD